MLMSRFSKRVQFLTTVYVASGVSTPPCRIDALQNKA